MYRCSEKELAPLDSPHSLDTFPLQKIHRFSRKNVGPRAPLTDTIFKASTLPRAVLNIIFDYLDPVSLLQYSMTHKRDSFEVLSYLETRRPFAKFHQVPIKRVFLLIRKCIQRERLDILYGLARFRRDWLGLIGDPEKIALYRLILQEDHVKFVRRLFKYKPPNTKDFALLFMGSQGKFHDALQECGFSRSSSQGTSFIPASMQVFSEVKAPNISLELLRYCHQKYHLKVIIEGTRVEERSIIFPLIPKYCSIFPSIYCAAFLVEVLVFFHNQYFRHSDTTNARELQISGTHLRELVALLIDWAPNSSILECSLLFELLCQAYAQNNQGQLFLDFLILFTRTHASLILIDFSKLSSIEHSLPIVRLLARSFTLNLSFDDFIRILTSKHYKNSRSLIQFLFFTEQGGTVEKFTRYRIIRALLDFPIQLTFFLDLFP